MQTFKKLGQVSGEAEIRIQMVSRGSLNYKGKPIFDTEINEAQAETVRLIFQLYTEQNYGVMKIAGYLNDRGILTKTGVLWNSGRISGILNNKIYYWVYELYKEDKEKDFFLTRLLYKPCDNRQGSLQ